MKRSTNSEVWRRRLDHFPPILVRLLARDRYGSPLSARDISLRSGLDEVQVNYLSQATSWEHVPMAHYLSFCSGCGLDLLNRAQVKRQESYLKGRLVNGIRQPVKWLYLKRDTQWESYYKPLMERYIQSLHQKLKPQGT